jgi:hypothetical protein
MLDNIWYYCGLDDRALIPDRGRSISPLHKFQTGFWPTQAPI